MTGYNGGDKCKEPRYLVRSTHAASIYIIKTIVYSYAEDSGNEVAQGGPNCPTKPFLVPVSVQSSAFFQRRIFTLPVSNNLHPARLFSNPWAVLPYTLANVGCGNTPPATLLSWLNTLFATDFTLTPGVESCLVGFIDDGCDLGQVYGYLRPWVSRIHTDDQFAKIPIALHDQMQQDFELRSAAINSNQITNPRIPPRRIWDLYANRVLPYYALARNWRSDRLMPDNVWSVSHSWVAFPERQYVNTTINSKAWHVPIPRTTTLEAIRTELLTLGAEYVFLDVLCLRQEDKLLPEFESIRKREWRLDVPTIGHVYNEDVERPVIVYFNGLGRPFKDGPIDHTDKFYWFNRVWTLQETAARTIFGGTDRACILNSNEVPSGINEEIISSLLTVIRQKNDLMEALHEVRTRQYSNAVDQVASLAYLLRCPTLPIYDADIDVEVAWSLLVECLPEKTRTELLFSNFGTRRLSGSWRPSWEQMKTCTALHSPLHPSDAELLKYITGSSPLLGYKHGFDAYYHQSFVVEGCRIRLPGDGQSSATVELPFAHRRAVFEASDVGQEIDADFEYVLISVGHFDYWLVGELVGTRRIRDERALEVSKISTLRIPDHNRIIVSSYC